LAELGEGEEPPFELERIPARTPMLQPLNPGAEINMLVHHSGKYWLLNYSIDSFCLCLIVANCLFL
jgi:hypothetical protein